METDLSEYHKGTDGLYYADYIAPNKAETFIGRVVASQRAVCPNMQLPDRRQTEDCLIRFSKTYRFLRTKIRKCEFQNSGERHSLAV